MKLSLVKVVNGEGEKGEQIPNININTRNITDPEMITDYFDNYFSNTGQEIPNRLPTYDASSQQLFIRHLSRFHTTRFITRGNFFNNKILR